MIKIANYNASKSASKGCKLDKTRLVAWSQKKKEWSPLLQKLYVNQYINSFEKTIADRNAKGLGVVVQKPKVTVEEKLILRARKTGALAAREGCKLDEEKLKNYVENRKWSLAYGELYITNYKEAFNNRKNKMLDKKNENAFNKISQNDLSETECELESFGRHQVNTYLPTFSAIPKQNSHDAMAEDFAYTKNNKIKNHM